MTQEKYVKDTTRNLYFKLVSMGVNNLIEEYSKPKQNRESPYQKFEKFHKRK